MSRRILGLCSLRNRNGRVPHFVWHCRDIEVDGGIGRALPPHPPISRNATVQLDGIVHAHGVAGVFQQAWTARSHSLQGSAFCHHWHLADSQVGDGAGGSSRVPQTWIIGIQCYRGLGSMFLVLHGLKFTRSLRIACGLWRRSGRIYSAARSRHLYQGSSSWLACGNLERIRSRGPGHCRHYRFPQRCWPLSDVVSWRP
jgi:hypothetical protein